MLLATDLADYLVKRGVPFRQAHEHVGRAVALCNERGCPLPRLPLEDYQAISPAFGPDLFDVFDLARAMASRRATGAPSPANVAAQLERWKAKLGSV
jgi:argininosuccinate lyase